jgi:hypothetical protein
MREDFVHVAVRRQLVASGWRLVAGQYPRGTEDLPTLYVTDPILARDASPDPRRHSLNKLVPDLVACCGAQTILIEMKEFYDPADVAKLDALLDVRRDDLVKALVRLSEARAGSLCHSPFESTYIKALGLPASETFPRRSDYAIFSVAEDGSVAISQDSLRRPQVPCHV